MNSRKIIKYGRFYFEVYQEDEVSYWCKKLKNDFTPYSHKNNEFLIPRAFAEREFYLS